MCLQTVPSRTLAARRPNEIYLSSSWDSLVQIGGICEGFVTQKTQRNFLLYVFCGEFLAFLKQRMPCYMLPMEFGGAEAFFIVQTKIFQPLTSLFDAVSQTPLRTIFKIPYTGDTKYLNVCGCQHCVKKLNKIFGFRLEHLPVFKALRRSNLEQFLVFKALREDNPHPHPTRGQSKSLIWNNSLFLKLHVGGPSMSRTPPTCGRSMSPIWKSSSL